MTRKINKLSQHQNLIHFILHFLSICFNFRQCQYFYNNLRQMGQTSSSNLDQQQYLKQYQQIAKIQHGTIISHKTSKARYLLKLKVYTSEKQFRVALKNLQQQQKSLQSQNITKLVNVWVKQSYNFCSTTLVIYSLFQYPELTLSIQLQSRRIQGCPFQEPDLWNILQSFVNYVRCLKNLEIVIQTKNIYIEENGLLKIGHPQLIDNQSTRVLNRQSLYAPQRIQKFNNLDHYNDIQKQLSFNLGMLIVECALLTSMTDCYDYVSYKFKEKNLRGHLAQLSKRYSHQFLSIVLKLLAITPQQRINIDQLQRCLDNHWSQQQIIQSNKSNCSINANYKNNVQKRQVASKKSQDSIQIKQSQINGLNLSKDSEDIPKSSQLQLPAGFSSFKTSQYIESIQTFSGIYRRVDTKGSEKQNLYTDRALLQSINNFKAKVKPYQNGCKPGFSNSQLIDNRNYHITNKIDPQIDNIVRFIVEVNQQGQKFQGLKANNLRAGYGKLTYPNGSYFQGTFKNNQFEGLGKMYQSNGQIYYEGNFSRNKFNGKGILYNSYAEQATAIDYKDFDNSYNNWVRYQGYFSNSLRHGSGKLIFTNGDQFEGEFFLDRIHGNGIFKSQNHQIQGCWLKNILIV